MIYTITEIEYPGGMDCCTIVAEYADESDLPDSKSLTKKRLDSRS
jgi:hypothetical protein